MNPKFVLFSEVISQLTPDEDKWLRHEFELVYEFDGKIYTESEVPDDLDAEYPDWHSYRWCYPCDEARNSWNTCLLYTSDAADDLLCVDLGGRRIIKKKKKNK